MTPRLMDKSKSYHPIFFKSGQLGPSESGTKQELQSTGKFMFIQFSDLWGQTAKQSEMQGCLFSICKQASQFPYNT